MTDAASTPAASTPAPSTPHGQLLEHVAKQLVEDPAAVVVTETKDGDFLKLHLMVGEADVGKVIGRGGRIAKAIRALLKVMATRDGSKVNLEID